MAGITFNGTCRIKTGSLWVTGNKGLPKAYHARMVYTSGDYFFLVTDNHGLFRLHRDTQQWQSINTSLMKVRTSITTKRAYRPISAFACDPDNSSRCIAATKHDCYITADRGTTWKKLNLRGISSRDYITAVAIKDTKIAVGTSYNGIYIKKGKRFYPYRKGLPGEPYSKNLIFYEPVSFITFKNNQPAAVTAFSNRFFLLKSNQWKQQAITPAHSLISSGNTTFVTSDTNFHTFKGNNTTKNNTLITTKELNEFQYIAVNNGLVAGIIQGNARPRLDKKLSHIRAIYASAYTVRKKLGYLIKTIKTTGFNGLVIDMKDDGGNLYFPTTSKTAKAIKAQRRPLPVKDIISKLHRYKIHVIARVVVFKDPKLYRGYSYRYAIKNRRTGKPWKGVPHEYWVDPHSQAVQDYNIYLSKELEKLGFDEIQFDYIRFPADGPVHLCHYTHRKARSMYKSEALLDFLEKAKNQLTIPVSVDIYGFNSWYYFGNSIGQDMTEFARVVDVISPMVYPSHFGYRFYMKGKRSERSYNIIHEGCFRAGIISQHRVIVRPYLQAFKLLSPTYGPGYIKNQVKGSTTGNCNGYIFWNAVGDYSILKQSLKK